MVLREKVLKSQVQGNGAALARYQGIEDEQAAVIGAVPASVNCLIAE